MTCNGKLVVVSHKDRVNHRNGSHFSADAALLGCSRIHPLPGIGIG